MYGKKIMTIKLCSNMDWVYLRKTRKIFKQTIKVCLLSNIWFADSLYLFLLSLSLCVLKLSSIIFSIYDMFDLSYIWVLIHRLLLEPYFHISRLSWFVYEWHEPDFFHKMCQTPDISYCFALVNIFYFYGCRSYV